MVIYCTYDKENSTLVSRHRYVVAQNNNMSDKINIKCVGMTDPTAYGYYIDFVCMTHGGAAKAAYSSPALEYGDDGLYFDIPNCLTQYEGYVDAQLVIYEKSRESVVAKSVGRTGGIFEVAASVNSLETRVIEPANMLTELSEAKLTADILNEEAAKTVEDARAARDDLKETLASLDGKISGVVESKLNAMIRELPYCEAQFWFYDKLVLSCVVVKGKPLPEPEYEFPDYCMCGGWYSIEKGRHWDFASDFADSPCIRLYADCRNSQYVSRKEDSSLYISKLYGENVYLPFTFEGESVKKIFLESFATSKKYRVYVNDCDYEIVNAEAKEYVVSAFNSRYKGGTNLIDAAGNIIAAQLRESNVLELDFERGKHALCNFSKNISVNCVLVKGDMFNGLSKVAKGNYLIYTLVIKGNVDLNNMGDFFNLQAILLLSDTPELVKKFSYTSRNAGCKIYVPSQYMHIYRNNPLWEGTEVYPLEEYAGPNYSQTIYPTPEEFV